MQDGMGKDSAANGRCATNTVVKTPCLGICSTTSVGDRTCRGCKRFAIEVIDWNGYTAAEKRAVLRRLDRLVTQIMSTRFRIDCLDSLQASMRQHGVPIHPELSAHCWLHNLLKKRHRQLQSLEAIGVDCHPDHADQRWQALWEQADAELLALSEAHRLRYFPDMLDPVQA